MHSTISITVSTSEHALRVDTHTQAKWPTTEVDGVSRTRERTISFWCQSWTVVLGICDVTAEALSTELQTSSRETEGLTLVDAIDDGVVGLPVNLVREDTGSTIPTLIYRPHIETRLMRRCLLQTAFIRPSRRKACVLSCRNRQCSDVAC